MLKLVTDFFNSDCQRSAINAVRFGLCDDVTSGAYPDVSNPTNWIATVDNKNQRDVVVTAIDKCVILDSQFLGVPRCDAMLTTSDSLYLVELKDKRKSWRSGAKEQLLSTIRLLESSHQLSLVYSKKMAYACNRRQPFVTLTSDEQLEFNALGYRLDLNATVVVV
jgi:hypothetical protein